MYIAKKLKFLKMCPENMTIMIVIVFRHQPNCEYFTVYFRNHRTPTNASAASYNNVSVNNRSINTKLILKLFIDGILQIKFKIQI